MSDIVVQIAMAVFGVLWVIISGFAGLWAKSLNASMKSVGDDLKGLATAFNKLATDHGIQQSQILDMKGDMQSLQVEGQRQWSRLDDDRERIINLESVSRQRLREQDEREDRETKRGLGP